MVLQILKSFQISDKLATVRSHNKQQTTKKRLPPALEVLSKQKSLIYHKNRVTPTTNLQTVTFISRWGIPTIKFFLFKVEVKSKERVKSQGRRKNKKMTRNERIHGATRSNKDAVYTAVAMTVNTIHKV